MKNVWLITTATCISVIFSNAHTHTSPAIQADVNLRFLTEAGFLFGFIFCYQMKPTAWLNDWMTGVSNVCSVNLFHSISVIFGCYFQFRNLFTFFLLFFPFASMNITRTTLTMTTNVLPVYDCVCGHIVGNNIFEILHVT